MRVKGKRDFYTVYTGQKQTCLVSFANFAQNSQKKLLIDGLASISVHSRLALTIRPPSPIMRK